MRRKWGSNFWFLILLLLVIPACEQQINFPKPALKSITPTMKQAGDTVFNLMVMGSSFSPGSVVEWNGTALVSQFLDTGHMTATVPAVLIQNPGTATVVVFTTSPGGGTSGSLTFTITPAPSNVPVISSVTPTTTVAGSSSATLVISGSNFVSQSIVSVNNTNRSTFFLNSTSVQVSLTSADIATAGTVSLAVINPAAPPPAPPNGGTSNIFPYPIVNPFPVITSVMPISAQAGATTAPALSLTGAGFTPTSVIEVNGGARATTFVSATSLMTQLTHGDIAEGAVDQIQVFNATPGGGTSNIRVFTVNPTTSLGLPIILDLAPDGSQAANGICGTDAMCATGTPSSITAGPSTSNNGAMVAFASISSNLVTNDTNGFSDVFVRTTCLGNASCTPANTLVSVDPNGNSANGPSWEPTIDSGGATVAFTSTASNLTTSAPLDGKTRQVFWRQVSSTTIGTQLVSMAADGVSAGNGDSFSPVISPDSRFVAFVSLATNLVSNATFDGVTPQVFVRDTCSGVTSTTCSPMTFLVSTPDGTTPGNGASSAPSIASGGLFVAFVSTANNLGAMATKFAQAFVRSCATQVTSCAGQTDLISTPDGVSTATGDSTQTAISSNGRFIAFTSAGTNLGVNSGGVQEVYVRDTCFSATSCTPSTLLASTRDGSTPANALAERPTFDTTGQFIAFASTASNLGANTANGIENAFARNTCLNITTSCTTSTIVASQPAGTLSPSANGSSLAPSISGDGHTVSFLSFASNLVARDTNGVADVFLGSTTF